jgi:hypothetical protein
MQPVELIVNEFRGVARNNYVIEQGVPVPGITRDDAMNLGVFDELGNRVSAGVEIEHVDPSGKVKWVLVHIPVTMSAGETRKYVLKESDRGLVGEKLQVSSGSNLWHTVKTRFFQAEFNDPGQIRITTQHGVVLDGNVDFAIYGDARSAVGNLRPVYFEPRQYRIVSQTEKRVKVVLYGRYRAWAPKNYYYDEKQCYDCQVEFTIYADSPVIRMKWCITDFMKFNCPYMWLSRYTLDLPLPEESIAVEGEQSDDEAKFAGWAVMQTPGGKLATTFPFCRWLGRGAGIQIHDGKVSIGGVNPPPDGGFGGKNPDIWRKFYYGMSRTFEASVLVNPTKTELLAEMNPLCLTLDPDYYSECGALPENGTKVTFGPWKDVVERTAEYLLDSQWKGTLWYGEWWRERDVDNDLGIEETNSGNSALGPLYHFYRTGDYRYYESAKMSYYYTYDLQFCKREDGYGPYMHTRRFLLDHQEWFHPRYQRVGGMIKCSHFFGDKLYRDKVIWLLRYWADNYVADDGGPMCPNPDGTKDKCDESAMSNFADSLMYAYEETGDEWFLNKAKLIGDWVVRGADADLDKFCENSNSTRYILRGLLQLCQVTGEQKYIDTFCNGTHYVAFHFYYASQAYKWCGRKEILEGILKLAHWVLSKESPDMPGTYPFDQTHQYPPTRWICIYDNKAIVSYLPVLAGTLEMAGISPEAEPQP